MSMNTTKAVDKDKYKKQVAGKSKIAAAIQSFQPAIMPVVAVIPLAGLLMGIGAFFSSGTFTEMFPFLANPAVNTFSLLLRYMGQIVLNNLAIFFAISVAFVYSEQDGMAAFSGALGYLVFNRSAGVILDLTAEKIAENPGVYTTVLGIQTLNTGVFGGIICGFMVAFFYKKFKDIQLPVGLSFFQGKRFVAVMSILGAGVLAGVFCVIWPPIQQGIYLLGTLAVESESVWSLVLVGIAAQLLLPFGLHSLVVVPMQYEFGHYLSTSGENVTGIVRIFLAELADGAEFSDSIYYFSSGHYARVILIFVALAIVLAAKPENRKKTLGMYIPGIVTCFLTGITEPIQFSFMFTCFPLYAMTAILSVLTIPYASLFSVKIGTGFACGLLDFIIYGILPGNDRTNWIMFIPTCILYSLPVFALTYFAIKKFDWKTPGREDETEEAMNPALQTVGALAEAVYKRLGGKENIVAVNACATRLRVTLKSAAGMKNDSFNSLGASGTVIMGNNLQIIFGGKAANLRDQIAAIMAGSSVLSQETISALETAATEIKDEEIAVPMSGEVIPLAQVQDTVFAEGMLGDGFAVVPKDGVVYAPVNGVITNVMLPSKHAVSIVSDGGKEIMIHMGIDTVKLAGKGFEVFVKEGDRVTIGQKIATMDLNIIKENGYSEVVPMVFMNIPNYKVELEVKGAVKAGTKNFLYFLEKEPV